MNKLLKNNERLITTLIFTLVIFLLSLDIYEDVSEGSSFSHVFKESLIMLVGFVGVAYLWKSLFIVKQQNTQFKANIKILKDDLDHYKKVTIDLGKGLSDKINEQLENWKLTKSEKDVALLILKGLSNREIAEIRNSSEKTIKQHCSNLYQKSNITNRNELSAFFLEDILVLR